MNDLYAEPKTGVDISDCWFYHTIDLPGHGTIKGHWDLRKNAREYLGNIDFGGKRVLEVGPASGFLTAWMDKRGADVVAVEQPESAVWDFTPIAIRSDEWSRIIAAKRRNNEQLRNSFWLTHDLLGLRAKVHYGKVESLPDALGKFDIATLCMVLTHMRDPVAAIEACARRAEEKLLIVERLHVPKEAQHLPVMQFIPTKDNRRFDSWWLFSRGFFQQVAETIGFSRITMNNVQCDVNGTPYPVTTIVAEW